MTDRDTLLAEIQNHDWYQSIPLGDGITTDGETGTSEADKLAMMSLPDDLTGSSILDIGCNEGFYSFELESRGASPILAVDQHPAAKEKFALIHRLKGSRVEFRACDFFDLGAGDIGTFDIVLFLAVLHHVRYPLLAIDRIFELTERFALIEYVEAIAKVNPEQAVLVRRNSKKPGLFQLLPTRTFMLGALRHAGFSSVELLGEHRPQKLKDRHGAPGFTQQRVLLKALK